MKRLGQYGHEKLLRTVARVLNGVGNEALPAGTNDEELPELSGPTSMGGDSVGGDKRKPQDNSPRIGIQFAFEGTELMGLQSATLCWKHRATSPVKSKGDGSSSMGRILDSSSGSAEFEVEAMVAYS